MRKYSEKSLFDTLSKAGVITILTASCFLLSCKDDDKEAEVKPDKFLTATVGGNAFTAAAITSEVSSNGNAVSIEGVSSDGTLIQINLNLTDTKAGETYTVGLHQNGWYKDASGTFFFDDGTITVTELSNNQIEGTFTVEGEDIDDLRIIIQQGKFRTSYVK
jgi:hypothetical protein